MADYFERMNKTHESVVSALTYPMFVIIVAAVVVTVIMLYAVPTFVGIFEGMSMDLPWPTRVLIGMSTFFQKYILVMILLVILVVFLVRLYGTTEKGGPVLAKAQLGIPVLGSVVRMSNASQFAHTMSMLLTAGMPILQAIEVSGRTMSNQCMAQEILGTLPGVEGGRPFGECLTYTKEIPPMLVEMTAMGEATGAMESTLEVLAAYFDNETDLKTKRAISLLEPTIIVVLAALVVLILFAVYMPMFGMYGNM